ncbi:MAG: glycosyltransferase family 39 protein [Deltaproteobacteria bacterium]|nr:glycosyltransferase family 39 protein [Deltaproteobacteria bacterium]
MMIFLFLLIGTVIGLLLPGYLINTLLGNKGDTGASFILSTVLLFQIIFLIGILGAPINLITVGSVLLCLDSVFYLVCRKKKLPLKLELAKVNIKLTDYFLLLPIALLILLIFLRSAFFKMPMGDKIFRWYLLAQRIFETETFSFYPPLSAGDFNLYFYPESFPPIVSFCYFWLYALAGKANTSLTAILVVIQYGLILLYAVKLSQSLTLSKTANNLTLLLLGSSSLLFYSSLLGQESGLTTLSLMALSYYLARSAQSKQLSDIILAAFSASLGTLCREYGLIFVGFGVIILLWRKTSFKHCLIYLGTCAILALPWYIRTTLLTHNPFYSNPISDLFPVNPVLVGILNAYKNTIGLASYFNLPAFKELLFESSMALGIPFFLGLCAAFIYFRRLGAYALIILMFIALWIYSIWIPGGIYHSLRIVAPAIALASVCAAFLLNKLIEKKAVGVFFNNSYFVVILHSFISCQFLCSIHSLETTRRRYFRRRRNKAASGTYSGFKEIFAKHSPGRCCFN